MDDRELEKNLIGYMDWQSMSLMPCPECGKRARVTVYGAANEAELSCGCKTSDMGYVAAQIKISDTACFLVSMTHAAHAAEAIRRAAATCPCAECVKRRTETMKDEAGKR